MVYGTVNFIGRLIVLIALVIEKEETCMAEVTSFSVPWLLSLNLEQFKVSF